MTLVPGLCFLNCKGSNTYLECPFSLPLCLEGLLLSFKSQPSHPPGSLPAPCPPLDFLNSSEVALTQTPGPRPLPLAT